jgi:hypothetical protein
MRICFPPRVFHSAQLRTGNPRKSKEHSCNKSLDLHHTRYKHYCEHVYLRSTSEDICANTSSAHHIVNTWESDTSLTPQARFNLIVCTYSWIAAAGSTTRQAVCSQRPQFRPDKRQSSSLRKRAVVGLSELSLRVSSGRDQRSNHGEHSRK